MKKVTASWQSVDNAEGYNVYLKTGNGSFEKQNSELVENTEFEIGELGEGVYESYVTSFAVSTESQPSNIEDFFILAAPQNLIASYEQDSGITTFGWDHLIIRDGYNLYLKLASEETFEKHNDSLITGNVYEIEDLIPDEEYEFYVVAVYEGQEGPQSAVRFFLTSEAPLCPTNVQIELDDHVRSFYTDFSEYETGQQPSDWTKRWNDDVDWKVKEVEGATGGKVLHFEGASSAARRALSWNALDTVQGRQNIRIEARLRGATASNPNDSDPRFLIRGNGQAGNETGYVHGQRYGASSVNRLRHHIYEDGSGSSLENIDFIPDDNVWANVVVEVNFGLHRTKAWESGDSEPSEWMIEESNTNIMEAGWLGFAKFGSGEYEVDWIKITILD